MFDGFELRERRKAHYIQIMIAPHYGKQVPKITDIMGFGKEKEKVRKRVARSEQEATLAELEEMMKG